MKRIKWLVLILAAVIGVTVWLLVWRISTAPEHPIAVVRVVDAAGSPVAGAVIQPDALRPKSRTQSEHFPWKPRQYAIDPDAVVSGEDGYARIAYPRHVFERVETGEIRFTVNHPGFVPDRSVRPVAVTPPAGASWRVWADYWWSRVQHKTLLVQTDPVALQLGATLRLSLRPDAAHPPDARLFAQDPTEEYQDTNFWIRPEPGVLRTHRLPPDKQTVRVFQVRGDGSVWFSTVVFITGGAGRTNVAIVGLKAALAVHGQLDEAVPRPVRNGRVIVHVWPHGHKPEQSPPQWHAWTAVREDGGFDIPSLPPGMVEVVALCDGFISTNGPGKFPGVRYPQKHSLDKGDLSITIGMEPTARLEVKVTDDKGSPLEGAVASAAPNVRYGDSFSTVLAGDCYNTLDRYLRPADTKLTDANRPVPDFQGTTDSAGLAIIPNLPAEFIEFSVEHPRFVLPAVLTAAGDQVRQALVNLLPAQTNRITVQLERRGRFPISDR